MYRLLGFLLALALAVPGAVVAAPCNAGHPCPPEPVAMGRLITSGAETADLTAEGVSNGTPSYDTGTVRSGARSFHGATNTAAWAFTGVAGRTYYARAYFRKDSSYDALAANNQVIHFWDGGTEIVGLHAQSDGTMLVRYNGVAGSTILGSASGVLAADTWYRLELSANVNVGTVDAIEARIDGVTIASGSGLAITDVAMTQFRAAMSIPVNASHAWFDDIGVNDDQGASQNTWLGDGKVVLLLPVTDNATGTGWNLGTNTAPAGAGHTALANTPPVGVADLAVGSDPKQMRNATSNANVNVDMNMTTYSAAGIAAIDTINVIDPITITGAPVTTGAKAGTVGVASNPAIANIALGAAGTPGAFWQGNTAGTYPTGWKLSHGTTTYGSSVTVGTAPVMRVTQVTASTRIAMVCFMGMYVDYTPGVPARVPYVNPMPPILAQ